MQKKIIALAIAGLASTAAFAQTNVTVYGVVDMGLTHKSDSISKAANRTGIDTGIQSGSRIGFRGTEDLGNGLKANFVLEYGITPDVSHSIGGQQARQSWLGLAGNFGEVRLGRMNTPEDVINAAVDPFGQGTTGANTNITRNQARLDNVIAYFSPNMSGFQGIAAYTKNGAVLGPNEVDNDNGVKVWALAGVYANGPLFVGLNYHVATVELTGASDFKAQKRLDLGATYDFGMVKLHGLYGTDRPDADAAKTRNFMIGASAPVGAAGRVMLSYNNQKQTASGFDDRASMWAVGYTHSLSKRTNLYASYSDINNKNGAASVVAQGSGNGARNDYQKGLTLGVRHSF